MRAVTPYFLKILFNDMRFEVARTVSLKITVLSVVESCELIDRCKLFDWTCYPICRLEVAPCKISASVNMEAAGSSRKFAPIYGTARRHQEGISISY